MTSDPPAQVSAEHRSLPREGQRVRYVEAPEVTSGGTEARLSRSLSPDWAP